MGCLNQTKKDGQLIIGDGANMKASYIEDFQEWEKGFSFYSEARVRFSETDMYGHMNNTVSFTYFEQARIDYFRHVGILMPSVADENVKSIPIVADLQCDYVKQVFFDDVLRIYTKIAKVGSSSMDIHYLAKIKGMKCASQVEEQLCKWTLEQVKVYRFLKKKEHT